MRHHILFIGPEIPVGWGEDYATFVPQSVKELREVIGRYMNVESDVVMGLDVRSLVSKSQDSLLKFLEETRVSVILRMNEPIKGTILSRVDDIKKKSIGMQKVRLVDVMLAKKGKIGEKVGQLV